LAAGADVLPNAVVTNFGHEVPAASTLVAGGGTNDEPVAGRLISLDFVQRRSKVAWRECGVCVLVNSYGGNVEYFLKRVHIFAEKGTIAIGR
jgi:hypothetical protein